MEKIIIYAGLSISFDEARKILDSNDSRDVIYKRPIKRGDLNHDLKLNPTIIGIIDGVFHQNSAVGHREILNALNKGIKVFGASSMGALRASELDSLGMYGIGYVYNEYASGNVISDDDVAVMLDCDSLEALSEPLINMNYVFKKAFNENIINKNEKEELMRISKETYYPKRNFANTLSKSSLDDGKKSELIDFIRIIPDIKKDDAKKLLRYIGCL